MIFLFNSGTFVFYFNNYSISNSFNRNIDILSYRRKLNSISKNIKYYLLNFYIITAEKLHPFQYSAQFLPLFYHKEVLKYYKLPQSRNLNQLQSSLISQYETQFFEISKTSFIMPKSLIDATLISSTYSDCFGLSSPDKLLLKSSENPIIEFKGVLNSCETFAINSF